MIPKTYRDLIYCENYKVASDLCKTYHNYKNGVRTMSDIFLQLSSQPSRILLLVTTIYIWLLFGLADMSSLGCDICRMCIFNEFNIEQITISFSWRNSANLIGCSQKGKFFFLIFGLKVHTIVGFDSLTGIF